ncbi:hypothetical protein [Pleomorphovibrio marinus]|uniref:hypothetical protein n=1 Tax=Pleomorphovibrio marinus TaxID=2164132 RepID=UPI000E0C6F7E|nr:hypothetical protein [Pleomorphovibrio marinus]
MLVVLILTLDSIDNDLVNMIGRTNKRLLIGVSSPVGYLYEKVEVHGKPAPVLESPLSYFLLYDEIWFLSKNLCPNNMEKLDFVHFVDRELMSEGLPVDFSMGMNPNPFGDFSWTNWREVIRNTIGLRWRCDNHTRSFNFGELSLFPTPGKYLNLLVDRYIATSFDMDLVENSANFIWSQEIDQAQLKLNVSEQLLTSSISSFQTIDGPWHPEILNLRGDNLLKKYRKKIQNVTLDDIQDVDKRVGELSMEFEKVTSNIVSEHFDTSGMFKSTAMFLVGLIPFVGNFIGGGQVMKEIYDKIRLRQEKGWIGFLGRAQGSLQGKK